MLTYALVCAAEGDDFGVLKRPGLCWASGLGATRCAMSMNETRIEYTFEHYDNAAAALQLQMLLALRAPKVCIHNLFA